MDIESCLGSWDIRLRISSLLESGDMTDVTFVVGDPPQTFAGHKLILSSGSQVFQAMFYGKIPEKDTIIIPDITATAFSALLQFLYTDKTDIHSSYEAFDIAYAAKKYMLQPLYELCENYLDSKLRLCPENVCSNYEQANFLDMKTLKQKCFHYIARHFLQIFRSESFPTVSFTTVKDLLQLDTLHINSEREIVEFLCTWGLQFQKKDTKATNKTLKSLLRDLLCYVRFLLLSARELDDLIKKYDFLDIDEQIALLLNIALPRKDSLLKMPTGFSCCTTKRSTSRCARICISLQYRFNDSNVPFRFLKELKQARIDVLEGQLTILGIVTSFRPIVEYSESHRSLQIELTFKNCSSSTKTSLTTVIQPNRCNEEDVREILLDEPFIITRGSSAYMSAKLSGEGILLPHLLQQQVVKRSNTTDICIYMLDSCVVNDLFPIKELMCIFK